LIRGVKAEKRLSPPKLLRSKGEMRSTESPELRRRFVERPDERQTFPQFDVAPERMTLRYDERKVATFGLEIKAHSCAPIFIEQDMKSTHGKAPSSAGAGATQSSRQSM
jgi:hypothetical protein